VSDRVHHRPSGLRVALLLVAALAPAGCFFCLKPWQRYRMPRPPDLSCFEPGIHGWTLFVWECVDGERVVIGQFSTEMMCRNPVREKGPCGQTTPLERERVAAGRCVLAPDANWPR
jgi:hypothetical protein